MRQKLLYITPVLPAIAGNGLAMRAGNVLEALAARYRVSLLVVPLYPSMDATLPPAFAAMCERHLVLPAGACRQVYRARDFDCVHVFRLAAIPIMDACVDLSGHPFLQLDLDDIESKANRRLADLCRINGLEDQASALDAEAARLAKTEDAAFDRFNRVFVCSLCDQRELQARTLTEIAVLPNTIHPAAAIADRADNGGIFRFLFVGSLGVYANEDAVVYFCEQILPILRRQAPRPFAVHVVGTYPSARLCEIAESAGVRVVGPVPEVASWYRAADAVIVPLRAGGGTRIKILEAFHYGRPVVSTPLGAEGLDARHGEHLLIADHPAGFADHCRMLMEDSNLSARIAESAAALLQERYAMVSAQKIVASWADFPALRRSPSAAWRSWSNYISRQFDRAPAACEYPGRRSPP
jgi:glycosyltransferase involved in cell wall biosynthesis